MPFVGTIFSVSHVAFATEIPAAITKQPTRLITPKNVSNPSESLFKTKGINLDPKHTQTQATILLKDPQA